MPELPEVETLRSALEPLVTGRCVLDAWAHRSAKFTPATAAVDATILGARRRGKFLLLPLDDGRELVIHLGMTGRLSFGSAPVDDSDTYRRAWFRLGRHRCPSTRRSSRSTTFDGSAGSGSSRPATIRRYPALAAAGPEPWDPALTPARFHGVIEASSRAIKTQLLSQRPIAGVGQHLRRRGALGGPVSTRGPDGSAPRRAERLLGEIRTALQRGIDNGGTTLRDYRRIDGAEGDNRSEPPGLRSGR